MRLRAILTLVLALVMGGAAVLLARNWLFSQLEAVKTTVQQPAQRPQLATLVVAAGPLRFGQRLDKNNVRSIDWPAGAIPAGAFHKPEELLAGEPRMVLQPIEENEPILAGKITGPGVRATLSAIIGQGMRALTLRVNDVLGVAGFVLPGDRVDILLTRQLVREAPPITDVLMQNIKVLGIDQEADQKADKPAVVKAVTFEVTAEEAQKLTLASQLGTLSLALRGNATVNLEKVRRIGVGDLDVGQANNVVTQATAAPPPPPPPPPASAVNFMRNDPLTVIGITRGLVRQEYRVLPSGSVVLPGTVGPPQGPGPGGPGPDAAGQNAPGQNAPGQGSAGQGSTGQGTNGQGNTGQGTNGQGTTAPAPAAPGQAPPPSPSAGQPAPAASDAPAGAATAS